jgi:hypothetical protein
MAIHKYSQLFICLFFLGLAGSIHTQYKKPLHKVSKQEASINFKDEMFLTFHLCSAEMALGALILKPLP